MKHVPIGDLAAPGNGSFKIGPFGSSLKKHELVPSGIPVASIENVLPNVFVKIFRKFITHEKYEQLAVYQILEGDVVVTTMGTIGRAAVVPPGVGKIIIDSHLFRMRLDRKRVDPKYLAYAINGSGSLLGQLDQKSRGSIMPGLNTGIFRECTIPLPSLPEQARIAERLDYVARLQELNAEVSRQGDLLMRSTLRAVFDV